MSRLTELIAQVAKLDPSLAQDVRRETDILSALRPYGLNFERHIPEAVLLPQRTVRRGDKVIVQDDQTTGLLDKTWTVIGFQGVGKARKARLLSRASADEPDERTVPLTALGVVAEFRDPIYPGLKSTGTVERGQSDSPWHIVINGENYHALEALSFTHRGTVDCIYIDPPYNTRDKDWKYNNDYVDSDDKYRHSKWLAMMERRLLLAKPLLRPDDSALIVTINEREYLRLGLLLEQAFPEARIQMVTSVVSAKGVVRRGEFSRVEEHIFYVLFGKARIQPSVRNMLEASIEAEQGALVNDSGEGSESAATSHVDEALAQESSESVGQPIEWLGLRRREPSAVRGSRKNQFFPIFVDIDSGVIQLVGDAIDDDVDRHTVDVPAGTVALWPLKPNGREMIWGLTPEAVRKNLALGYIRINRWKAAKRKGTVQYLPSGTIARIRKDEVVLTGRRSDGSIEGVRAPDFDPTTPPKRVWHMRSHNAETGGTKLISALIPGRRFDYPKSLYAVEDTLRFVVGDKPNAVVLDFFAGSGTTAHAVMRLNREDGGRRQSIMVTNNEVSAEEAEALAEKHAGTGDPEWETLGVYEHITKPRILAAITGETPEGGKVAGSYGFGSRFAMQEGFDENAEFLDLTYEDPEEVRYGWGFEACSPLFWLRAGAQGRRVDAGADTFSLTDYYAILFQLDAASAFTAAVREAEDLRVAYIVTDDESQYQVIASQLPTRVETVRLYASYLDNFRFLERE
jgi:adenine-specific DNA-methyltransferase